MKMKVLRFCLLGILLLLLPSYISASLDSFDFKIIRIAFMNGYSRALDSDIETIQALKEDVSLLEKRATNAADRYMMQVAAMNNGTGVSEVAEESTSNFQRNTNW